MRKIYFIDRFDHKMLRSVTICAVSSEKKAQAWVRFYEYANKGVYFYDELLKKYLRQYTFTYNVGYMHTELPYQYREDDLPF